MNRKRRKGREGGSLLNGGEVRGEGRLERKGRGLSTETW